MTRRAMPWLLLLLAPVILSLCLLMGASRFGLPDTSTEIGLNILWLRVDRVFTGFLIGAALAVAGVVLQTVLRNPLAEPYVLGVSSGGGLGAALAITTGIVGLGAAVLPLSAFVLASLTLALVYWLGNQGGRVSLYGLILSGVIVSSCCSSILMFLIALAPVEGLHNILWWMLGNMEMHSQPVLAVSAILIAGGLAGLWALTRDLNALALGQEMAHHVGVRTRLTVFLALALATLITSTAVALGGLIGFVGLVVPHAVRSITGPNHGRLIPASAIAGGLFLALCDALARTVMAPRELPVGVITALIGGPFFLWILRSRRKQGWME